ncbi:uncharacterized protein LOC124274059 isoform X2 [Haliotis rubra]|uniref:uncharacterized protein LOC124274059 isoform X2 n=1 Tax=Haliotis rubra TaxID=36100 RepID=UPI001EE57CF3|nr:uncharacterized protein LOC124274059 isoform X2 [Haliotis rubra]
MDLVKLRDKFIWTWILAGICVSVIVTGRGSDAQNYLHDPYIVSPERVQYGSDVNITCYILSMGKFVSQIYFIWSENGERLTHGGNYDMNRGSGMLANRRYYTNTLTVKTTRMTDEGKRYTCQVQVEVGAWSSSLSTDEYIFGQEVSSTTTTTASEGEDVTISLTGRVTVGVMGFWSPSGELIATIQSISVYI